MMHFETMLLTLEMRLQHNEQTKGIDAFMNQLNDAFPDKWRAFAALRRIILESKCPEIRFENIRALGISMGDKCIISNSVLRSSFARAIYVILHEIAHQMQYTKYGEDFAAAIFMHDITDEQMIQMLKKIELTADRYAIAKGKQVLRNANAPDKPVIHSSYKSVSDASLLHHIHNVRANAKKHNLNTIMDINEWIYNSIKSAL